MKEMELTALCTLNMGQSPESSTYNEQGNGLPFFQGNADFGEIHPTVRVWCSAPTKIANAGDILISVRAPIGAMNIAEERCCIGRGLAALTPNLDMCTQQYLYYALQSRVDGLIAQGTGSTFKAISKKVLEQTLIPVYSFDEQLKIVKRLEKVEQIISFRKKQLATLDELVKARFVEMFGDTVLNPFGWEKEALGLLCDVRDGTHDSPKYYETGFPLVTSKNVTGGKIDLSGCSMISEEDYKKISIRSKVDIGDIIMPMIGTGGKPVIVDIEPDFAIKNVSLIKFKSPSKVLNVYVRALLLSDYFDDAVISKVRGGTQKFISLGDIRKLNVLVPPMELQNQFAAFVQAIDQTKSTIQASLDELETLKKSLMQDYWGG